jgi:alkaline phosphatase D
MVARLDHDDDLGDLLWNDAWDGYPAARDRLLDQMVQRSVSNPVFISGDWHSISTNGDDIVRRATGAATSGTC